MTPAELIGQSIMFRFGGPAFTDEAREPFREIRPGGVLFFADNITSREQVHGLTTQLQAEARDAGMPPLLIAADQEGGIVSRFSSDFVTVPGAMALAASSNPADIESAARITALQLREVGINVNFAPSVDINNNPANPVIRTRSFGDTPEQVISSLESVYRAQEAARVMTTVKHFPGHGDTNVDSHLGLPTIPCERERIDAVELAPFRAAVELGIPAVMSAHILFPELDPDYPATLSRAILTDLLRDAWGFSGLIFTDSMSMKAISDRYGVAESSVLAKLAGVDVFEANEPLAIQRARHQALNKALESGRLPTSLFEATVQRLDAARQWFGITGEPTTLPEQPDTLRQTAVDIAIRTIAHAGAVPFRPVEAGVATVIVDFQRFRGTEAEDLVGRAQVLRDAVNRTLPGSAITTLSDDPTQTEIAEAVRQAGDASIVVILTRDASDLPRQAQIANQIIAAAPQSARIIHCCMRGPYDAGTLDRVSDSLFTFGDPAVSIEALVAVLAGAVPTARMPVTVPGISSS